MTTHYDLVADVASMQPDTLNYFQLLKRKGVKAVIIKLTEGSNPGSAYLNPKAKNQLASARAAGLLVHGYHFAQFISIADARLEAQWFVKCAKQLGLEKSAVLMLDMESRILPANATACANAFVDEVHQLGYARTDIYTSASWIWSNRLVQSQLKTKNLMIAAYNPVKPGVDHVGTWQFTSRWEGMHQDMSYDFFGYYTQPVGAQGHQLSLDDTYTVRPGDSWWLIAKQHNVDMTELAKLNGKKLSDFIYPGQKLKVH